MKNEDKIYMKYIVFCEEHYNSLGIVRSLGEKGVQPYVIVIKRKARLTSASKYIKKVFFVDSIAEGYQVLLSKFGKISKDVLFTADDKITSYLDVHYEDLKDRFYFFNAGITGRINYYMDKMNIHQLASECGLLIPQSLVVENGEIPENIEYPIITKALSSISGGWKDDVFVCNNSEELLQAFPKIKSKKVILQQYIKKENELCLDGFSYDHGGKVFFAIASTYDYLLPSTYSSLMTVCNFEKMEGYINLKKCLESMFSKIGFEGIFSVEFLISREKYYFLEINFRNSTWSYASTVAHMNLPILWSKCMENNLYDIDSSYKEIPENFKAMDEMHDFKVRVLGKKVKLFKWLEERRNCNCLFYKNKNDRFPYYRSLLNRFFRI